jgi:hypothetical protein
VQSEQPFDGSECLVDAANQSDDITQHTGMLNLDAQILAGSLDTDRIFQRANNRLTVIECTATVRG